MTTKDDPQRWDSLGAEEQDLRIAASLPGPTGEPSDAQIRCWTWRPEHCCGCGTAADCVLGDSPPVRDESPSCPGQYGGDGTWTRHCGDEGSEAA